MSVEAQAPVAGLDAALAHALRLLETRPELAAGQARAILEAAPGHPGGELVLGMAETALGDAAGAVRRLAALAQAQPG
ncbi:MAG: hypothetical protein ACK4MU_03280, partial [Thermomonas sp.]